MSWDQITYREINLKLNGTIDVTWKCCFCGQVHTKKIDAAELLYGMDLNCPPDTNKYHLYFSASLIEGAYGRCRED